MATVDNTVLYNWSSIKEKKLGYLTHKKEVNIETEMATHSSILSWEIPLTMESGGLQFMGSQRFGHELATEPKNMRWIVLINLMGGSFYSVYHIILLYTLNMLQFYLPEVLQFSSVQSLSPVWLFAIPWTAGCQASLSITNSQSLLKLMTIDLVMPSNHLILCCTLLFLPSIFPSTGSFPLSQFFTTGGQSTGVSASAWVLPLNIPGLISFRMGWLDLPSVQGTLKSLLQHHSSKTWIL